MSDEPEKPEEIETAIIETRTPAYPFVDTDDQRLRCFIFDHMANPDIDNRVLLAGCQNIFDWIKAGKLQVQKKNTPLKVVPFDTPGNP